MLLGVDSRVLFVEVHRSVMEWVSFQALYTYLVIFSGAAVIFEGFVGLLWCVDNFHKRFLYEIQSARFDCWLSVFDSWCAM